MKKLFTTLSLVLGLSCLSACAAQNANHAEYHNGDRKVIKQKVKKLKMMQKANVIEIAKFRLADGMTPEAFAKLDAAVEKDHVTKQPGFIARKTAYNHEDREWLVTVYWESFEAADASMASFASAPAAAGFMQAMDVNTMSMKRYQINK